MYCYLKNKKLHIDLTGNLVLSHNDAFIKARVSSAAPRVKNGKSIFDISNLNWFLKIRVTIAAIKFIWGPSTALTVESIQALKPFEK